MYIRNTLPSLNSQATPDSLCSGRNFVEPFRRTSRGAWGMKRWCRPARARAQGQRTRTCLAGQLSGRPRTPSIRPTHPGRSSGRRASAEEPRLLEELIWPRPWTYCTLRLTAMQWKSTATRLVGKNADYIQPLIRIKCRSTHCTKRLTETFCYVKQNVICLPISQNVSPSVKHFRIMPRTFEKNVVLKLF